MFYDLNLPVESFEDEQSTRERLAMAARLEYDCVALNRVVSGKPTEADRCPGEFALDWQSSGHGPERQSISLLQPGKSTLTQLSRITLRVDDHQQLLSVMVCLHPLNVVSVSPFLSLSLVFIRASKASLYLWAGHC